MTLLDLPFEKTAVVKKINVDKETLRHIQSMGIIENEKIFFYKKSPLGNPRIYRCLNTSIAVRDDVAVRIEIELA